MLVPVTVIWNTPLYTLGDAPETRTMSPVDRPCALAVVSVAVVPTRVIEPMLWPMMSGAWPM